MSPARVREGRFSLVVATVIGFASLACGSPPSLAEGACTPVTPEFTVAANGRRFAMGFSRWPPDLTGGAVEQMYAFIAEHGDLLLHHLDNGVPFPEALEGTPFSQHLIEDWESARAATPAGHRVFVALTPLDDTRTGIAKYHAESDNLPVPEPWGELSLDHPDVRTAYLNYAVRAVDFFEPDYLAIGIEVNLLLSNAPEKWEAFQALHRETYAELKARYPDLPVFVTISLPHLRGDLEGADPVRQQREVAELISHVDLVALGAYPYNWTFEAQRRVPGDYFDPALAFGKTVAVAETGLPSRAFTSHQVRYEFEVADQTQYIELLLRSAAEHGFEFVVNWAPIDFEPMLERFDSQTADLARYWAYTGLARSDGCPKPALEIWDAYLELPTKR